VLKRVPSALQAGSEETGYGWAELGAGCDGLTSVCFHRRVGP
jgi:hypothetical protein